VDGVRDTATVTNAGWSLRRLQAGETEAWRAAFRELWPLAYRTIALRIASAATAEDLAQETLTVLSTVINKLADDGHIKPMTVTIAQRKAAHFLRDETAGKRDRRLEVPLDAAQELEDATRNAVVAMDLSTALAKLDPVDRELIEGHFIGGFKSHELAVKYGMHAGTVRGRMKRALDKLKSEVESGRSSDVIFR
jgi:RNA polymerase sigma factor (sigma-70 family)